MPRSAWKSRARRGGSAYKCRGECACKALSEDARMEETRLDLVIRRKFGRRKRSGPAACGPDALPQAEDALLLDNGGEGMTHPRVLFREVVAIRTLELAVSLKANLDQVRGVGDRR
eukprot:scaffold167689_cov30-Tisochrysis_lutea.AAC.2